MAKISDEAATKIAQVVHESVRAWQKANHQPISPAWGRAAKWMKSASIEAVRWRLANPTANASAQHDRWMAEKAAAGWKHGRTKNGVKKTHPLMVAYRALPEVERRKDALVNAVIDSLAKPMR
ncbi:MAG: hypothetical protein EON93_18940 [Burkholderiales bacterium]|nr:MAG: hypothetical protein EON93_18940 [Burkholderiales bacterium]